MAQAPQPQQSGLGAAMPNAAAVADQFQNQQKPFGWLMDMIQHITGQMQPQQSAAPAGQPAAQPAPQPGQQQPQQQGSQQSGQKQSQAQPGQPGMGQPEQPVPGGQIDPNTVQQLVSLFQPNALSNLGLLPQQQGSWNWVLSMMQQGQAAQAQQKGMGGNDLISLVRQLGGQGGGAGGAEAGGAGKAAASGAAKTAAKAVVAGG